MSEIFIFIAGTIVSLMVVGGSFLFTFFEFSRMGQNPEKFLNRRFSQSGENRKSRDEIGIHDPGTPNQDATVVSTEYTS